MPSSAASSINREVALYNNGNSFWGPEGAEHIEMNSEAPIPQAALVWGQGLSSQRKTYPVEPLSLNGWDFCDYWSTFRGYFLLSQFEILGIFLMSPVSSASASTLTPNVYEILYRPTFKFFKILLQYFCRDLAKNNW